MFASDMTAAATAASTADTVGPNALQPQICLVIVVTAAAAFSFAVMLPAADRTCAFLAAPQAASITTGQHLKHGIACHSTAQHSTA